MLTILCASLFIIGQTMVTLECSHMQQTCICCLHKSNMKFTSLINVDCFNFSDRDDCQTEGSVDCPWFLSLLIGVYLQ